MKNTISIKYIVDYIEATYGPLRHNADHMAQAIRKTANKFKVNKVDLFHLIIETRGNIMGTTSYGFQTAYGRELVNDFQSNYYIINRNN